MKKEIFLLIGQFLGKQMQEKTKYGFSIDSEVIKTNINRLTN
jgi:hypothetical protein